MVCRNDGWLTRVLLILLWVLLIVCFFLASQPVAAAMDVLVRDVPREPEPVLGPEGPPIPTLTVILESGDTVTSLARQFGVSVETLLSANPDATWTVGEEVTVVRWEAECFFAMGGERIVDVAAFYRVPLEWVLQANGLCSDAVLEPGQRVWVLTQPPPANGVHAREVVMRVDGELRYWALPVLPVVGPHSQAYGGPTDHHGLDIAARFGHSVRAARWGTVAYVGWFDQWRGQAVVIDHGGGLYTVYAHINEPCVLKGDRVKAGQVIATVGHNGHSTGPHLHFEVRVGVTELEVTRRGVRMDGEFLDPAEWLGVGE